VVPFLSNEFTATAKNAFSSTYRDTPLDKDSLFKFSTELRNSFNYQITSITQVAEGHTVVSHIRLNGEDNTNNKKLENIDLVSFYHFNMDNKVESITTFFDLISYNKQLGI